MNKMFIALVASAMMQAAVADPYSWEVRGGYSEVDESELDGESYSLNARYYFQPIDNAEDPLAELAFLSRSSYVNIGYAEGDSTQDFEVENLVFDPVLGVTLQLQTFEIKRESDTIGISFSYILPESGWIFGARASTSDNESTSSFDVIDGDSDTFGVRLGKYIAQATRLEVSYQESSSNSDLLILVPNASITDPAQLLDLNLCSDQSNCDRIEVASSDGDTKTWIANLRHFLPTQSYDYAFDIGVVRSEIESTLRPATDCGPFCIFNARDRVEQDQWEVTAEASMYFTREFGVAVFGGTIDSDGSGSDANLYGVAAEWFATPSISISVSASRLDPESSDNNDAEEVDTLSLVLLGRF